MRLTSVLLVTGFLLYSCKGKTDYRLYHGRAQGTTFTIKYKDGPEDLEHEIDSILKSMDYYFSTYTDSSWISQFNKSESGMPVDENFRYLWERCWELSIETDGYFDPTLSAVFKLYGEVRNGQLDSAAIKEALVHTGMPLVVVRNDSLIKKDPGLQINLNAVAQGYSVDVLADYLESLGIKNYLVEIGGEVRTKGKNELGKIWHIGIDKPIEGKRIVMAVAELKDFSLATSGNYRKFVEVGGRRLGHIINPKTGFPERTNVLSVSVFSKSCYRSDALATALMNHPVREIIEYDQSVDEVDVLLIYTTDSDTNVYVSPEMEDKVSL